METPTEGVNPLDWLIDISSIDNTDVTNREESKRRVASLISAWVSKGGFWEGDGELEASKLLAKRTNDSHPEALEIVRDDAKRPGILKQTYVLTRRFVCFTLCRRSDHILTGGVTLFADAEHKATIIGITVR
jgi:hypothetical protein